MRLTAAVAVLSATLAACEPPREAEPARAAPAESLTVSAAPVAQTRYHIARPLHELTDSTGRAARSREQAIGVVVPSYGEAAPQELSVVNDTAYEIQTVARVRFYPEAKGGWTDTIWTREPGLYAELIRATHDDYGLPVVAVHGKWLRVHFGYAADGSPRAGWVRLVPNKSVFHDRDRQMFEFSTSLANPDGTEFFKAPDAEPVRVDLRPSHTLQVVRIAGDWIQVVLLRPDTTPCTGNEDLEVSKRDTVWVRRYDKHGKRQLLSAVAGC